MTQLEKLAGKGKLEAWGLIEPPAITPILVPESDKRPAIEGPTADEFGDAPEGL